MDYNQTFNSLGIRYELDEYRFLSNRHIFHLKSFDKMVFTFICNFLKRHGFFEWSEWYLFSIAPVGFRVKTECLLPRPGAHIPLPKAVKVEALKSTVCEYCKLAVCVSNCEQEIEKFNNSQPDLLKIAEETGIPYPQLTGTGRGTTLMRVAEGQNLQPGQVVTADGEIAQLGDEAPIGVVMGETTENNEVEIQPVGNGAIVWTRDGNRWVAEDV